MHYWILKTEPNCYAFDDLLRDKKTHWDGVRNFQARNNLAAMKKGDTCLIYHSVGPKEIVGVVKVSKEAYPDPTSADPRWLCVDVEPVSKLKKAITLEQLKHHPSLHNISLVKQSRLSVCPIDEHAYKTILAMAA